jgi:hypothetical protein
MAVDVWLCFTESMLLDTQVTKLIAILNVSYVCVFSTVSCCDKMDMVFGLGFQRVLSASSISAMVVVSFGNTI